MGEGWGGGVRLHKRKPGMGGLHVLSAGGMPVRHMALGTPAAGLTGEVRRARDVWQPALLALTQHRHEVELECAVNVRGAQRGAGARQRHSPVVGVGHHGHIHLWLQIDAD